MPQSFIDIIIHFVFSTKNRRRSIDPSIQPRLHENIGGIVKNKGGKILAIGGMADHIHLLVSLPKNISISDFIRDIKANSSRWMHRQYAFQKKFSWQNGYGAFSVSHSRLDPAIEYIKGQKRHHRSLTFREEVLDFLKRRNLPYDERYMWE